MRTVWLLQSSVARWKNRRNIVFLIVLIIAMISTIYYVREQEKKEATTGKIVLGVAMEDTSEYAELLLQYFNENEDFLSYIELIEAKEQELETALAAGTLDAYLVIPEQFAESMIKMDNLPIRSKISMKNPTKALVLRHVMEAYESYIEAVEVNCTALYRCMKEKGFSSKERNAANVEISLELIFTALGKDDLFRKRLVETEENKTLSLVEHYQYTGVYFVMLFLFIPAGINILKLKRNRMLMRLKAVNVPVGSVLLAEGIPYMIISALLLLGVCCVKNSLDRMFPAFLLLIPWLVVFLVLGLACKDDKQYLFICSMVLVCMAVLGGSLLPETVLPDSFQNIARWMPNRNFTYVMGGVLQ